MTGESLLFVAPALDAAATCALLVPPRGVVQLTSTTGETVYEDEVDYVLDRASGVLTRLVASRIPFTTAEELHPRQDPDGSGFMHLRDDASTFLLTGDSGFFHARQVAATYTFDPTTWTGWTPSSMDGSLPRTREHLRRGDALSICVLGDSISEGYTASGFIGLPPFQPPYAVLVATALERMYGAPVTLRNCAVAGSTSDDGVNMAEAVALERPDLVIVAFGMNDAGYADADYYAANIRAIVATLRALAPEAECVLVSSMLPNPEWHYPRMESFAGYRAALARLCETGVALADVTRLWHDLMRRKSPYDLTGNGINHPNDFGHRLYADVILSLLA